MATAKKVTTDLTTCPICMEVFDNPKSLPCLHAFCLKCLESFFKDRCPGDAVPCPMCRKEFEIPSDGLGGLQHHFIVQQLVDARNASRRECREVGLPCEVCLHEIGEDSDTVPTATTHCVDCNQKLCEQCSRPHRRMREGAHQLRSLRVELEQQPIQPRQNCCHEHTDKRVELCCYDCQENICVVCFAVEHRQHKTAEIPEAADTFSQMIGADVQRVSSMIRNVHEKTRENEERRNAFLDQTREMENEIKMAGDRIREVVANQVDTQLAEVVLIRSEEAKKAYTVEERYQIALVAMENFHTAARQLLDTGGPSDITRAASELHERATQLLDNDVTSVQYCPPHVTFTPVDVTQAKRLKLIGKVLCTDEKQPGRLQVIYYICTERPKKLAQVRLNFIRHSPIY